ncbi:MAG: hypothetical protein P1U30_04410 [Phycisphaerales bacterium]|nr:hypothetical protein [Phycisphaerales bacterium]
MDDRQTEIRAGAGLEDSRINKEFIDFLNKWSSPVILVFAIAALVWAGLRWMEQKKVEKIDRAFGDLQAATMGGNPSPASLNVLAETYAGVRSVPVIAKLTTTDLYLTAYLRGVQPGSEISRLTGEPVNEGDVLDENQRQLYLDQAGDLAKEVIALTEGDDGKALLTIHGLIRAGAVAECKRDFDGAASNYNRVITLADQIQMPALGAFGQMRLDALGTFDQEIVLPNSSDLVALPGEEVFEIPAIPETTPETDSVTEGDAEGADAEASDSGIEDSETPEANPVETDQP